MIVKIDVAHYNGSIAVKSAFRIKLLASRGMGQTRTIFNSPLCYVFFHSWTRELWSNLKSLSSGISDTSQPLKTECLALITVFGGLTDHGRLPRGVLHAG